MKVSLKDIVDALGYLTDERFDYVDRQTGKVESVSREVLGIAEEGGTIDDVLEWEEGDFKVAEAPFADWDRFEKLPTKHEIHEWEIMREFAESVEPKRLSEELQNAISRRRRVPVFQGHAAAVSPRKGLVRFSGRGAPPDRHRLVRGARHRVHREVTAARCYTGVYFMISSTQMRPGMVIKFNNDLFSVFSVNHRTPGNLRGFVQAKMRNLRSGTMIEHRFSSEDKVERAALEEHEMEYLYDDGEYFYFMNTENYEQMHLTKELLGDAVGYLVPQLKVAVEFYEGNPISVELPATVDLTVVETEPGMKGASVSNVTKPAKLETGLVVQVPPFIAEGEKIRVSTAEGTYQERA